MATQTAFSKLTIEEITMDFDMLSRMAPGESVATASIDCEVFSGVDADPTTMISGEPAISNNVVSQAIKGGLPGVIYLVNCSVRTSRNNVYINQAKLAVLSTSAPTPPTE